MELFSWQLLGSFGGAVLAVSLMTQLTKSLPGVKNLPTQLWSYLLALVTLWLSMTFGPGFSWARAALALFNAVLVSLAANGSYAALGRMKGRAQEAY